MTLNPSPWRLGDFSRRQFRNFIADHPNAVAILPTAAVEQHLEHLAIEHDWRSVSHIAKSVAIEAAPYAIVAEGLMVGVSEHHMKHPGTLTLAPGTFLSVVSDMIDSLVRAQFKNILVLNGHGGNVLPINSAWDQWLRRFQVNLRFVSYWDVLSQADANELLRGGRRIPDDLPGHAQEFETALARAFFPENIREEAVADQPDPGPALASAETGYEFSHRIVSRLSMMVKEMSEGLWSAKIPSFYD